MKKWLFQGCLLLLIGSLLTFCVLVEMIAGAFQQAGISGSASNATGSAIADTALQLAQHLHPGPPNGYDVTYDGGLPGSILTYWQSICPNCTSWHNGTLQCGMFVSAAYGVPNVAYHFPGLSLVDVQVVAQWWDIYKHQPGWEEIPATGVPLVGSILMLDSPFFGGEGHVGIITNVTLPTATTAGQVEFAEANGPEPLVRMPLRYDVKTNTFHFDMQWEHYIVLGYIHSLSTVSTGNVPSSVPHSPYVKVALQDAQHVGIPPRLFVAQIMQESGFNPLAVSSAGAEGIAQIMPATAQSWGVNPWNPESALYAAAQHMATYNQQYQQNYGMALAAYNAGPGAVDHAIQVSINLYHTSAHWLEFVPLETQQYVTSILSA